MEFDEYFIFCLFIFLKKPNPHRLSLNHAGTATSQQPGPRRQRQAATAANASPVNVRHPKKKQSPWPSSAPPPPLPSRLDQKPKNPHFFSRGCCFAGWLGKNNVRAIQGGVGRSACIPLPASKGRYLAEIWLLGRRGKEAWQFDGTCREPIAAWQATRAFFVCGWVAAAAAPAGACAGWGFSGGDSCLAAEVVGWGVRVVVAVRAIFHARLPSSPKLWGFPRDLASLLSWWVSLGRLALARLLHRSPRPRACLSCPVVSPSPAPLHKLVRFRGPKPKDSSPSSWPQERPCAAAARKGHSHRIVASGGGEHVPERSRPPGHPGCASPSPAPSVFEHSHSARDHPRPAQAGPGARWRSLEPSGVFPGWERLLCVLRWVCAGFPGFLGFPGSPCVGSQLTGSGMHDKDQGETNLGATTTAVHLRGGRTLENLGGDTQPASELARHVRMDLTLVRLISCISPLWAIGPSTPRPLDSTRPASDPHNKAD